MAPSDMTPQELADELSRLHEDGFGWALSCCGWNEPQAEDVLQTAYVRVISGKARFGGRSAFRTWFFGVIRRVAQEHCRRDRTFGRRHAEIDVVGQDRLAVHDHPVDDMARAEDSRRLLHAMDELPERQREVLHLVFYQDMTIAEAAAVMGVGLGSARTHYDRGKKRMRVLLEEGAGHG